MKLDPNQFQRIDGQLKFAESSEASGDAAAQRARDTLHKMAVDLVSKSGSIKTGYVKLVEADGGGMRVGTRWSRSADGSTRDALNYVRSLVDQGYGANPKARAAIEAYVKGQGERLGTHSFVKLVRELENAGGVERPQGDRISLARVKADARLQIQGFVDNTAQVSPQELPPSPFSAQVASQEPPRPPAESHKAALEAVRRGQRADAVKHLQQIEGALNPEQLARFLVQDDLQGRAISTQMVLMAEAAYSSGSSGDLDKVAEFIFAGTRLPHAERLDDPQFDANQALSGLFDVVMLWQARRPAESQVLAQKLADLLTQKFPQNASAGALAERLRLAGIGAPISISQEAFEETFNALTVDNVVTADEWQEKNSRIQTWLQDVEARNPSDEALKEKIEKLKTSLENIESTRKEAVDQGRLNTATRNLLISLDSQIETVFAADEIGKFEKKLAEQTQIQGHVSVNVSKPEQSLLDTRSFQLQAGSVANKAAAKMNQPVQGSNFLRSAVTKADNSNFVDAYDVIGNRSKVSNGQSNVNLQRCILSGRTERFYIPSGNLSGSDLTFSLSRYHQAKFNFNNVNLDDARIHIDYAEVERELEIARGESQKAVEELMRDLMSHDPDSHAWSMLKGIASIDDRYAELKTGLMRDAIELMAREHCIEALAPSLKDVLNRSPVFLNDPRIRELTAPVMTSMS